MAANKRKILENARKLAQKGAKDKALKEYQRLLKLDPRDAKLKLEIGDVYRRWGQVEEAIDTYTKVADQYMKEGFDARAVAVFKQILNLDPDRHASYVPLADLYERMGLTAEAIQALQTAADGYHRDGKKREALELLRKMATIDPSNTTSRMKVADLLRQEGMEAEAVSEYQEVATEFGRQGDVEAAGRIYRRILEIDGKNAPALVQLSRNLLGRGKAAEAEPLAQRAVELAPEEPDSYALLADVVAAQGREQDLPDIYKRMADVYRRRGDDDHAREILQRYVPAEALSFDAGGLEEADEDFLDGDELSGDDLFGEAFIGDGSTAAAAPGSTEVERPAPVADEEDEDEVALEVAASPEIEEPAGAPVARAPRSREIAPEAGDPDQLIAEASVYLRYGKRDKAIEHLESILASDADHGLALEKLGEAYADGGETERAVELWQRAAKRAVEDGDLEAVAVLRDRIAALDEDAASSLGSAPISDGSADLGLDPAPEGPEFDADELDLDIDDEVEVDIDVEVDVEEEIEEEVAADGAGGDDADAFASAPDEAPDLALDDDEDAVIDEDDPGISMADVAEASLNDASLSTATTQQVVEDLEEADFYVQQGLFDEAEAIYQRVLSVAPNHPLALVRLGEVVAAREGEGVIGSEDGSVATAVEVASETPVAATDEPRLEEPPLDDLSELDLDDDDAPSEEPDEEGAEGSDTQEIDPADAESAPEADELPAGDRPTTEIPIAVADTEPEPPSSDDDSFDLAAALADAFDEDPNAVSQSFDTGSDDGFSAVFDAFKKGVDEQLGEGDHEAHYDLGIAYKEMGLHDDAIREFRLAMLAEARRVGCLHLIGVCAIDGGQPAVAVEGLDQLLALPDLTEDQRLAARFDLGRAQRALGSIEAARTSFEAVAAIDPGYCDVRAELDALDATGEPAAMPSSDGDFESFDDLVAEATESDEAEEAGESFEDLVAEADLEDEDEPVVAAEPEIEPAHAPEPEPDPEPEPEPVQTPAGAAPGGPSRPRKKKKKISFV